MFIVQALLRARSPHVVYFLLASWIYSLGRDHRAHVIPAEARKLPLDGAADVRRRVSLVREELDRHSTDKPAELRELENAAAALSVACEQLRALSRSEERRVDDVRMQHRPRVAAL